MEAVIVAGAFVLGTLLGASCGLPLGDSALVSAVGCLMALGLAARARESRGRP